MSSYFVNKPHWINRVLYKWYHFVDRNVCLFPNSLKRFRLKLESLHTSWHQKSRRCKLLLGKGYTVFFRTNILTHRSSALYFLIAYRFVFSRAIFSTFHRHKQLFQGPLLWYVHKEATANTVGAELICIEFCKKRRRGALKRLSKHVCS